MKTDATKRHPGAESVQEIRQVTAMACPDPNLVHAYNLMGWMNTSDGFDIGATCDGDDAAGYPGSLRPRYGGCGHLSMHDRGG